jgi:hypothetical protein
MDRGRVYTKAIHSTRPAAPVLPGLDPCRKKLRGSTLSAPQSGTKDVPTRSEGTRFHRIAGVQSREREFLFVPILRSGGCRRACIASLAHPRMDCGLMVGWRSHVLQAESTSSQALPGADLWRPRRASTRLNELRQRGRLNACPLRVIGLRSFSTNSVIRAT